MDHSLLNSSLHLLSPNPNQTLAPGPIKPATLWRRSRSESDVSTNQSPMPINDAAFICEHCGQGFAMHDRLAKHIASRHRDRSASVNDENSKIHKCTLCPKSFGRSDMLTRHLRLHSGIKPYACQLCGQVFSRSDHLSTHQRTHTGEKPYRCPHCNYAASRRDMITRHMRTHLIDGLMNADGSPVSFTEMQAHELQIPPIGQLSLNQASTPEPSCHNTSSTSQIPMLFNNNSNGPTTASSPGPSRHLSSPVPPLASKVMSNSSTSLSPAVSSLNLNVAAASSGSATQQINNGLCAGGINRSPSLTITSATSNELLPPNFSNLFQFKPKTSVDSSALGIDEATRIGLLSAAAANSSLTHMLTSLGRSLDAQVPNTSMCRSSPNIPNLLNQMDHPSAFKPLKTNVHQPDRQPTNQDSMQQAAVAAMNRLFGEVSQANTTPSVSAFSPNLSAAGFGGPPSGRLSPSILRQNSIGGIGFSDAAPATTTN